MFAIRIEYPTGRVYASRFNDRTEPEWPPHPARLFSALVATWAEDDPQDSAERAALAWLEHQPAPEIACEMARARTSVTHFVPVNDAGIPSGSNSGAQRRALALLPEHRVRQPRHFPSAWIDSPLVYFIWRDADPGAHGRALSNLMARLVRVGHSSSLVIAATVDEVPAATMRPAEDGEPLRVVAAGQLDRLIAEFDRHRAVEPRVLPFRIQRYTRVGRSGGMTPPRPDFSNEWIVFRRVGGARVLLTQSVRIANAVRGSLMRYATQPPDRFISGHEEDGAATVHGHVAVLPLPHVGHAHADGAILGVALVPTATATHAQLTALRLSIAQWETAARQEHGMDDAEDVPLTVGLGGGVEIEFERVAPGATLGKALQTSTWCRPARHWLSVTPVALDRNPGDLRSRDPERARAAFAEAEASVLLSCTRIGLPEPSQVTVLPSGTWSGSAKARQFPAFPSDAARPRRVKAHVRITFSEPVAGPILLGAGRFQGLGLLRPDDQE